MVAGLNRLGAVPTNCPTNNLLFFVPPFGKSLRFGGGFCLGRSEVGPFQGPRTVFTLTLYYSIFPTKSQ